MQNANHDSTPVSWIVEDDPDAARAVAKILERGGCAPVLFATGGELLTALNDGRRAPDIICLDLSLPDIHGLDLIPNISNQDPHLPIIVVTGNTAKDSIEQAVGLGVYDYLPKNSSRTKFATTIRRAVEYRLLSRQLAEAMSSQSSANFGIVGVSPAINDILRQVRKIGKFDATVLIEGETGTGKELVARGLHAASKRHTKPFLAINCASLSAGLLESELFGHERGAFTGADRQHIGAFERANGGTIFLDEIGELEPVLQAKLLRAIQGKSFYRIGGNVEVSSDFRLLTATNRNLLEEAEAGRFRADLFYRLGVTEISLPPLRSRTEDIPLLAYFFINDLNNQFNKKLKLSAEVSELLSAYPWPGNVRELQNVVHHAFIQCNEPAIYPHHLPERILGAMTTQPLAQEHHRLVSPAVPPAIRTLKEQEKDAIILALRETTGHISEAATLLGISRATLYRMLKRHKIPTRGTF